jgi:hypothetical protein
MAFWRLVDLHHYWLAPAASGLAPAFEVDLASHLLGVGGGFENNILGGGFEIICHRSIGCGYFIYRINVGFNFPN